GSPPPQIDRAKDLAFAWNGPADQDLYITVGLDPSQTPERTDVAFCRFPGTSRTGTMPAAFLSVLPTMKLYLGVWGFVQREITVGSYAVALRASSTALANGGADSYDPQLELR